MSELTPEANSAETPVPYVEPRGPGRPLGSKTKSALQKRLTGEPAKRKSKLNPSWQRTRFAHEYVEDYHAGRAAQRAGYAPSTAMSYGPKLLRNLEVQRQITEIEEERRKRLIVNRNFVLETLMGIIDRCKVSKPSIALSAAVRLGQHLGMWSEKNEKLPKRLEEMDSDEIRALLGNGYLTGQAGKPMAAPIELASKPADPVVIDPVAH